MTGPPPLLTVNGRGGEHVDLGYGLATPGDAHFPTRAEALTEAVKRAGIDPTTVQAKPMYGKNPNLLGAKGQPWERIQGLTEAGDLVEFDHHSNGHNYEDTNEFELPHYHGPDGEHLTYGE